MSAVDVRLVFLARCIDARGTPCHDYYMNTTTAIATSAYGNVHEVTINSKGIVHTTTGVLLGDVEGMTRLGWEFTSTRCPDCSHADYYWSALD